MSYSDVSLWETPEKVSLANRESAHDCKEQNVKRVFHFEEDWKKHWRNIIETMYSVMDRFYVKEEWVNLTIHRNDTRVIK